MTADEILAVPESAPERLFGTQAQIAPTYRALARRWHPDHAGRDDVFKHLLSLRQAAERLANEGGWPGPGMLALAGRRIRYFRSFPFELGRAYLGNTLITYVVAAEYADLARRAEAAIAALHYADARMQAEMAPRMPQLRTAFTDEAGRRVVVLGKPPGTIRLQDLIAHQGGRIDPRHLAWMISELLNLAAYLGAYLKLCHLDLSPDTLLIAPGPHVVIPVGGWFYATPAGGKLAAIPARTERLMPASALAAETALPDIDLELIRATGREALGDPFGTRLMSDPEIPRALATWLRTPGSGDPVAEYRHWSAVLTSSFGARRFVTLPVTASGIYGMEAGHG